MKKKQKKNIVAVFQTKRLIDSKGSCPVSLSVSPQQSTHTSEVVHLPQQVTEHSVYVVHLKEEEQKRLNLAETVKSVLWWLSIWSNSLCRHEGVKGRGLSPLHVHKSICRLIVMYYYYYKYIFIRMSHQLLPI